MWFSYIFWFIYLDQYSIIFVTVNMWFSYIFWFIYLDQYSIIFVTVNMWFSYMHVHVQIIEVKKNN